MHRQESKCRYMRPGQAWGVKKKKVSKKKTNLG